MKAPNLLKVSYDPAKDLVPIATVGEDFNVLAAHPGTGFKTVADLVAAARAKPGALNYSSAGKGSPGELCGEMVNSAAGIKVTHVPYSGAGPAMTAVVSGEVQLFCGPASALLPQIKSGKLVALGVTSEKPYAQLPDVKPLAVTWPGLTITSWYAFYAPPRTPAAIVEALRSAVRKAYDDPAIRERLSTAGIDSFWIDGAGTTKRIESDLAKWHKVIVDAHITVD